MLGTPGTQLRGAEPQYEVVVMDAGVSGTYQIKRVVDMGVRPDRYQGGRRRTQVRGEAQRRY